MTPVEVQSLPEKPGVYRYLDADGTVIYVGKAKNLKKRVSSYFNKQHDNRKLQLLVQKISHIEFTVVDNEWEALLLENSLIKQYQPRYNSLLKDDKSYPWIVVTKEEFPRVFVARHPDKERSLLFGPYPSQRQLYALMEVIENLVPLRSCRTFKKGTPCLQFQIKRCAAPCADKISAEEYQANIKLVIDIIKGNLRKVLEQLRAEMMAAGAAWEFERAIAIEERIKLLQNYQGRSVVVNPNLTDLDVFSLLEDDDCAYVNFLRTHEGAVIQALTLQFAKKMDEERAATLARAMVEIEKQFGTLNREIVVPFLPETAPPNAVLTIPQRGDKKHLLNLSEKNCYMFMSEKVKRQALVNPERQSERVLEALRKALYMSELPNHIECFDNSNTQGDEPVAAMVCFIKGKPAKKEYRHYNIKTVVGADDFASMEEVVFRRYQRLLDEQRPLPDLVIIDGGKGQLGAAHAALEKLGISDKIMLIGIAKRLEDIYKFGDSVPLCIDKRSEAQKLLQRIRDEVHRFGIGHHRKRRANRSISSELDDIPGIGKVLSQKLLTHFKSVARIRAASEAEIAAVIGAAKARVVFSVLSA